MNDLALAWPSKPGLARMTSIKTEPRRQLLPTRLLGQLLSQRAAIDRSGYRRSNPSALVLAVLADFRHHSAGCLVVDLRIDLGHTQLGMAQDCLAGFQAVLLAYGRARRVPKL